MNPSRILLTLCTALLLTSAAAQDLAPVPPLKTRVTDVARMLKPNQRAALEKKLQEHETQTGNQVAILIVNNTGAEAIEQYGIRVAETWKIGRKGIDDGVILIVAKDSRKLRLEVGRGAEGVITDLRSKRILQDVIAPRFRQNDFYGGLNDAVTVIHALLDKETFPSATNPKATADPNSGRNLLLWLFFAPLIVIGFVTAIIRMKQAHGDAEWGRGYGSGNRIYLGPGWYFPGSGGSNDSGGNFDGGGWDGGGGDFGGGGASGGW